VPAAPPVKDIIMQISVITAPPPHTTPAIHVPLLAPRPPRLSRLGTALEDIEQSGMFSNFGPVNMRFETEMIDQMFRGAGACVTVANATLGLMLAIRQAIGWRPHGRYALMPSFTFAATAQAAIWCGLTPLFCDIDRETWLPDAAAEEALLRHYGDEIAVILPNATYGNCLDLARYDLMSRQSGIPLVIDAAAGLGSVQKNGEAFGKGSTAPLVFSMHATKCFATGEGGLIYCDNPARIAALRRMAGFGLDESRLTIMPGLNAKLSEVSALLALEKLREIDAIAQRRFALHRLYERLLPGLAFQQMTGRQSALQFVSVLLPEGLAPQRDEILAALAHQGIGAGNYFSPHLAEHPFFRESCVSGGLEVTQEISRRMVSLPMSDTLTEAQVCQICAAFIHACRDEVA
jgi:dTDP-4-amino-4,6-dideoxygalactose transaminase